MVDAFAKHSKQSQAASFLTASETPMARRKKNEGLMDILVMLPWWFSVATGAVAYIAFRWIAPAVLPPALKPIAPMLIATAWLPFAVFCMIGFVAFSRAALVSAKPGQLKLPEVGAAYRRAGLSVSAPSSLDHRWGRQATVATKAAAVTPPVPFITWTFEALRAMEWKRFELVCCKYYEAAGFVTSAVPFGADGGIDIKLFRGDATAPVALVQCKAWNSGPVGVAIVRELLGVITAEQVTRGILITTGSFSPDAVTFGEANRIQLLDGAAFLNKILALPSAAQVALLGFAFDGDYATPSCASCGIKLVWRKGKTRDFYGCANYPKCRTNMYLKA